ADVLAFDDVLELHLAGDLGEDGRGERIPLDKRLSGGDVLSVVHLQRGAVHQRVTLLLARRNRLGRAFLGLLLRRVLDDDQLSVAVDDHQVAVLVRDRADVDERHLAGVRRLVLRLLGDARRRTADVERTHGELRARLADRLRGDAADCLADLHELAAREIAAVAAAADSAPRLARQHRADLHLLDTRFLDVVGQVFADLIVLRHEQLAGERIVDILLRYAADDTVAERLENVAAFHDRPAGAPGE